jgi:hypothetical protein
MGPQLSGQLNSLRPVLEAVRRRSEREASQGKQETLGKAQISRIEIALADEYVNFTYRIAGPLTLFLGLTGLLNSLARFKGWIFDCGVTSVA